MKGTCNTATACTTQLANNKKIAVDVINTTCEISEDSASDSTDQKDIEESSNSTSQPSSPVKDPETEDPEVHSVSRVSIREEVKGSHKDTSEKVIISVKHSTPITSGAASTDFGPCSQEDFSSEGILLAARQQKLETNRKDHEKVIRGEIEEEQRREGEERLKLEQHLQFEEQERKRELQRKQLIEKQEQQRLQEKRVLKEKEDRLQQQIIEKQKKEEEQQRREVLKQRELERSRKRREEAESRAQQLREEQIRLQQEETARLERQCQFPDIIETQAVNMASVNLSQNIHSNSRGPANRQQLYNYNNVQKRQQAHRSSTVSSHGETPIKQRGARSSPNSMLNAEQMQSAESASPLFLDRLLDGEVRDFREFTKIIEKQNREIVELKNTNNEMEDRLEYQTRERIDLEGTIEEQEKIWDERCKQLSKERDDFDKGLQAEQTTNRKLWDIVYAKEKEIQRAYQRRYDSSSQANRRGHQQRGPPERGVNHQRSVVDRQSGFNALRSPHDLLEAKGSAQTAQERNAIRLLEGFFGC